MPERQDHDRNIIANVRINPCAKSFILCVYDVLARYSRSSDGSGRMVGNPYLISLRQSCPSSGRNRRHEPMEEMEEWRNGGSRPGQTLSQERNLPESPLASFRCLLGNGSLQKSDGVFAAQGAVMAKKYSSVRPKITSPLAEIQCSLESASLPGDSN